MQEKELHKLGKTDLLTIIYEQQKSIENLNYKIRELEEQLDEKNKKLEEVGSITEASIRINKIFEVAEEADKYLNSLKKVNELEIQENMHDITNEEKQNDTNESKVNIKNETEIKIDSDELIKDKQTNGNNINSNISQKDTKEKDSQTIEEVKSNIMLIPINVGLASIMPKFSKRVFIYIDTLIKKSWIDLKSVFLSIGHFLKKAVSKINIFKIHKKLIEKTKKLKALKIHEKLLNRIKLLKQAKINRKLLDKIKQQRELKIHKKILNKIKQLKELRLRPKVLNKFKKPKELKKDDVLTNKQKKSNIKKETTNNKKHKRTKRSNTNLKYSLDEINKELGRRKQKEAKIRFTVTFIFASIVVVAIAIIAATSFFKVLQVNGNSMEPSLQDGELLVTSKFFKYRKGDMIAFYYNDKILIKRVIATEGEIVNMDDDGSISVNGTKLQEDYVMELDYGKCDIKFPYKVPENSVFILGDNRRVSLDSRSSSIGCILCDNIIGKIKLRLKPFKVF